MPRSVLNPLVVLFTLGGIGFHLFKLLSPWLFLVLFLFFLLGAFLLKNSQRQFKSLLLYACYFCMGYLNFQAFYHQDKTHYLQNLISPSSGFKKIEVLEILYETTFSYAYIVQLKSTGTSPASGKLIVYQKKIVSVMLISWVRKFLQQRPSFLLTNLEIQALFHIRSI